MKTLKKIFFLLKGVEGTTEIIPLRLEDRTLFKARSTVAIKVQLPEKIGQITSIKVFHDNKGIITFTIHRYFANR